MDTATLERAACRPTSVRIFFPSNDPGGRGANAAHAKTICATCPVIAECERDHKDEPDGVWFGKTAEERGFGRRVPKAPAVLCKDLLVEILTAHPTRWFTAADLCDWVPRGRDAVQHALGRLRDNGRVESKRQPQNRPTVYRWIA